MILLFHRFLSSRWLQGLTLCAAACLIAGCQRESIQVYSVPKESSQPALDLGGHSKPGLKWTLPAGWKETAGSSMRVASFEVADTDGHTADISVTVLPVSDELINVNRWRGQLGLEPVEESALDATGVDVDIGDAEGRLHHLTGEQPVPQKGYAEGMLAAFAEHGGQMWFFKMVGEKGLVTSQKDTFVAFLKSVDFHAGEGHGHETQQTAAATPGPAPAPRSGMPQWQIPTGWESERPGSMVLAAFKAGGTLVTVSPPFGKSFGGMAANLNRWRSQVSLPPVPESEIDRHVGKLDLGGSEAIVADMTGKDVETGAAERLIVAVVSQGERTWFYKIKGNSAAVATQKETFEAFVKSAKY